MKKIAAVALVLSAATGCDLGNEITIDNQGTQIALVQIGSWQTVGTVYDYDRGEYVPDQQWVVETHRVAPGQRVVYSYEASAEVTIYRESDMLPLFHDTRLWDEIITVYP